MSVSRFPYPITTNFIPEAWDFTILNRFANFILTYPVAQNASIVFQTVSVGTATLLTQMANTSYVIANLVPYLATLPPLITSTTWLALQNFTTIETNTVNPISSSGTLTIGSGEGHDIRIASQANRSVVLHLGDGNSSSGGVLINSGDDATGGVQILNGLGSTGTITLGVAGTSISLGCPLTPVHQYPGISGGFGYRTGGIGYIAIVNLSSNNFGPGTSGSGNSMRNADLTPGIWFLAGRVTFPTVTNLVNTNNNFSTQLNNVGGQIARKGSSALGTSGTVPGNGRGTSTTAVVIVTANTRWYYNVCNATGGTVINCDFRPIRIA